LPGSEIAAYTIRRCTRAGAEAIASVGARLFVQAYGPTHPEPERSRYLAKAYSVDVIAEAIEGERSAVFVVEDSHAAPIAYAHRKGGSANEPSLYTRELNHWHLKL
jgi:hypothetical protein